jgi:hypothetical protein
MFEAIVDGKRHVGRFTFSGDGACVVAIVTVVVCGFVAVVYLLT